MLELHSLPASLQRLHRHTFPGKRRRPRALRPTLLGVLLSGDGGDVAWLLSAPGLTGAGLGPVEGGLWYPTPAVPGSVSLFDSGAQC